MSSTDAASMIFLQSEARVSDVASALADFVVIVPWPVQWGDQDAFGHVNNTVYFRWCETARVRYLERLEALLPVLEPRLEPILASIGCNYRRQVTYPDTVHIGMRTIRIGRTSMTMEHKIWSAAQQAVVADGQATVVAFDYAAGQSRPVPPEMRNAIVRLEGRPIEGA